MCVCVCVCVCLCACLCACVVSVCTLRDNKHIFTSPGCVPSFFLTHTLCANIDIFISAVCIFILLIWIYLHIADMYLHVADMGNSRSLLQNIVSFVGLFCIKDL